MSAAEDQAAELTQALNALRLGAALTDSDDNDGPVEATQVLDPKQQQELMALRAQQSRQMRQLDQHIVVMFTDLVGSTQYYERYGDVRGREKVLTHNALLFPIVQAHAGVIVKTIGDAIMAYFPTSQDSLTAAARMQVALRLYNRTITIADEEIHIRIALNAGVAIAQSGDIYGDVVNVAARIEHQAKADEILMSASVANGLKNWPLESAGATAFKGKAEPIELVRLRWREVKAFDEKAKSTLPARYQIKTLLARGSLGELFLAEDRQRAGIVVLKRLYDFLATDDETRAAFLRACKESMARGLEGAVRTFDISADAALPVYSVTERIEGQDLHQLIGRKGAAKPDAAASILARVGAIVQRAHDVGMLHGDVGPENVLVRNDGTVLLTNFGMANVIAVQLKRGHSPPGSTAFIAPELLIGNRPTTRSDVYSLGALLYFLLSGKEPIEDASSLQGTFVAASGGLVPLKKVAPNVAAPLVDLVTRAMAVSPRARPADVATFIAQLKNLRESAEEPPAHLQMTGFFSLPAPSIPTAKTDRAALLKAGAGALPLWLVRVLRRRPYLAIAALALVSFALGAFLTLGLRDAPSIVVSGASVRELPLRAPSLLWTELEAAKVIAHGDAFVVLEEGRASVEWYATPTERLLPLGRLSGILPALAVGRLIDTGKIRYLAEPIATFFPEWNQGKKREVTLRMVLEHRSGLSAAATADAYKPPDSVRFALASDVDEDPGSKYAFNPSALSLIAGVVQVASGKRIDRYLSDELISPLALTQPVWTSDQAQTPLIATGATWRASDLARLGAAFIDSGQERFFSKAWRAAANAPSAYDESTSLAWHLRSIGTATVFYAADPGGSFLLLVPERHLVAVRLTEAPLKANEASLDALLATLFPEAKTSPPKKREKGPASAPAAQ